MLPGPARVRLATARSTGRRAVEEAEEAAHRASGLGGQPPKCSGWPIWEYMTAPDFEQGFRGSVVRSAWKSTPLSLARHGRVPNSPKSSLLGLSTIVGGLLLLAG